MSPSPIETPWMQATSIPDLSPVYIKTVGRIIYLSAPASIRLPRDQLPPGTLASYQTIIVAKKEVIQLIEALAASIGYDVDIDEGQP